MNQRKELFIAMQRLLPKHALSRLIGRVAESRILWLKNFLISRAIDHFGINMDEAEIRNIDNYENFNAFFTRSLKTNARPVASGENTICSPADGVISQAGMITKSRILQAKGIEYSVDCLVGDDMAATNFYDGSFATIYLSPKDYHRVHMPVSGRLIKTRYIPGDLFSVNETTAKGVNGLFRRNERLVCEFKSDVLGDFVIILVGAILVAGIQTVWSGFETPGRGDVRETNFLDNYLYFDKGAEIGQFRFGSTAIILFRKDTISTLSNLYPQKSVLMGEQIATAL